MSAKPPPPPKPPKLVYTMAEVAKLLGVSYNTVHRICNRGLLRSSGGLRTKMFLHEEILRYLRDTTTEGKARVITR